MEVVVWLGLEVWVEVEVEVGGMEQSVLQKIHADVFIKKGHEIQIDQRLWRIK